MGKLAYLLLSGAVIAVGCGGDESSTDPDGGATGGSGGAAGAAGAAGITGIGGAIDASTGGSAGASVGGNPGVGGGSAGTCPTSAPEFGEACTDYATCCYGAGEIPFYCTPGSAWQAHPSGRKCCPAAEPVEGASCNVVPYLDCCYGQIGYRCDGASWSQSTSLPCGG